MSALERFVFRWLRRRLVAERARALAARRRDAADELVHAMQKDKRKC